MTMIFNSLPVKDMLKDEELTAEDKLVYLSAVSWFSYCQFKKIKCYLSSEKISTSLNIDTVKVAESLNKLKTLKYIIHNPTTKEIIDIHTHKQPTLEAFPVKQEQPY